jgi:hypothetical protein
MYGQWFKKLGNIVLNPNIKVWHYLDTFPSVNLQADFLRHRGVKQADIAVNLE